MRQLDGTGLTKYLPSVAIPHGSFAEGRWETVRCRSPRGSTAAPLTVSTELSCATKRRGAGRNALVSEFVEREETLGHRQPSPDAGPDADIDSNL